MIHRLVLLGALFACAPAALAQSEGTFSLAGRYASGEPSSGTLTLERQADGGLHVVRRSASVDQVWTAFEAWETQGHRRLEVLFYSTPKTTNSSGLAGSLAGVPNSRDAVLQALSARPVPFRAAYFFSADGDEVREYVLSPPATAQSASPQWESASGNKRRVAGPRICGVVEAFLSLDLYVEAQLTQAHFVVVRTPDYRLQGYAVSRHQVERIEFGEVVSVPAASLAPHPHAQELAEEVHDYGYYTVPELSLVEDLQDWKPAGQDRLREAARGAPGFERAEVDLVALSDEARGLVADAQAGLRGRDPAFKVDSKVKVERIEAQGSALGAIARLTITGSRGEDLSVGYLFDAEERYLGCVFLGQTPEHELLLSPRAVYFDYLRDFAENAGESLELDPSNPKEVPAALLARLQTQLPPGVPIDQLSQQGVGRVLGYVAWIGSKGYVFDLHGALLGVE
ncbi:MAG: hypothetical protein KDD82_15260 [Planctomycetes bacterium]|nr:hypothetical protein [Planctomycetota bacterium]